MPEIVTKKDPNGIRIGKVILRHTITPQQAIELVSTGRTGLIKGFISNRTKRPFDAHLTFDLQAGELKFDFPPRPERKPGTRGRSAPSAGSAETAPTVAPTAKKATKRKTAAKKTASRPARKRPARPAGE